MAPPTTPKPTSIIAQVAGSGTAPGFKSEDRLFEPVTAEG
jgi:hypothetical protein